MVGNVESLEGGILLRLNTRDDLKRKTLRHLMDGEAFGLHGIVRFRQALPIHAKRQERHILAVKHQRRRCVARFRVAPNGQSGFDLGIGLA